ncbi:MAG: glycoside hydrolase family 57 protein [Fidelibacterota bacterium]
MKGPRGYFTFILHSHLPFVLSHGDWPHGTDWLFEAAVETYIPLLNILYELSQSGITPSINIGITPVLAEQLSDKRFTDYLPVYIDGKIKAAEENYEEFSRTGDVVRSRMAQFWKDHFQKLNSDFINRYNSRLVEAFASLQRDGQIEIITSAATHGYLPLLKRDQSVAFQIKTGINCYEKHFNTKPGGIWLPECAYRPAYSWIQPVGNGGDEAVPRKGIEEFLHDEGIDYFITDSHMLKGGRAIGVYLDRFKALRAIWSQYKDSHKPRAESAEKTPYAPYLVGSPGSSKTVAVFTRDPKTALQVWSGEWGYPGDGLYLDFHKKHFPGGHRYWRVTDSKADLADKQLYVPEMVEEVIERHAHHFVHMVKDILLEYNRKTGAPGILVAPFDTELFGHWWFEGIKWLKSVISSISGDSEIQLVTCSQYIGINQPTEVISLPEGSWGEGGFHYIWLNKWTEWTWKHVYRAEDEMALLMDDYSKNPSTLTERILIQAARELLLMQSSDWQFLISTWSARDYAEERFSLHAENFNRLAQMARKSLSGEAISEAELNFLTSVSIRDNIFPQLKLKWWSIENAHNKPG